MKISSLERFLLKCFLVGSPLWFFGYRVAEYPFSFVLVFFVFLVMLRFRLNYGFIIGSLLILYLLIVSLVNQGAVKYSSLMALSLFFLPLSFNYGFGLKIDEVKKYTLYGVYLSFVVCVLDALIYYLGFSWVYSSDFILYPEYSAKFSYFRSRGGFSEPAWYASYLFIVYVFIDMYDTIRGEKDFVNKVIVLILLFFTFSLVGYFSLFIFIFFSSFLNGRVTEILLKRIVFSLVAGFVLLLLLMVFGEYFVSPLYSVIDRFNNAYLSFYNIDLNSSEGSRINAIRELGKYVNNGELLGVLFGYGYGMIDVYLDDIYGVYLGSRIEYARGDISNIVVVIFITFGIIGSIWYYYYLFLVIKGRVYFRKNIVFVFLVLQVYYFSTGFMLMYLAWYYLYLVIFLYDSLIYEKSISSSPSISR